MSEVRPVLPGLQFAAFVGIDWADQKHVWCLQAAGSEQRESGELEHQPEAVEVWVGQLCQRFANRPIAVAVEQVKGALVFMLSKYEPLHLFPVPSTMSANMTRSTVSVGSQRRSPGCRPAAGSVGATWQQVAPFGAGQRGLLERWPSLEELQKVPGSRLRAFFRQHHRRNQEKIEKQIQQAIPAIRDRAVIQAKSTVVKVITRLLQTLTQGIHDLDRQIEEAAAAHPDFFLFESLPGAGAVMAPRLLAAFGSQRERFGSAREVQSFSGR